MKLSPSVVARVRRLCLDVVLLDGEQDAAPSLADMARRAKFLLDSSLRQVKAPPKPRAPGKTKAERDAWAANLYLAARAEAFHRSEDPPGKPRCEVWLLHGRCVESGVDPDHVLGGAMKRECERLGAEGLQIMCRNHHELKTANAPTRDQWLGQAQEHAIRIGAKRLLPLIAKARDRYAMKHGARIAVAVEGHDGRTR